MFNLIGKLVLNNKIFVYGWMSFLRKILRENNKYLYVFICYCFVLLNIISSFEEERGYCLYGSVWECRLVVGNELYHLTNVNLESTR